MITKKDYALRYGFYFLDLIVRIGLPITATIIQFGLFKNNIGFFSQIQGTTIIAVTISIWIIKNDLDEMLKELENKGWYKANKRTLIFALIFIAVLLARNFADQMLFVIGSFLLGSLLSNITTPIHQKYKNKIKKYKQKEKDAI